jgi:hypothetical protein
LFGAQEFLPLRFCKMQECMRLPACSMKRLDGFAISGPGVHSFVPDNSSACANDAHPSI